MEKVEKIRRIDSHCAPTVYYIMVIKWTTSFRWNICKRVAPFNISGFKESNRYTDSQEGTITYSIWADISSWSRGKLAPLTPLNMSAAFDTVDHEILLRRLDATYGIQNGAVIWIASYISDRTKKSMSTAIPHRMYRLNTLYPMARFWDRYYLLCTLVNWSIS